MNNTKHLFHLFLAILLILHYFEIIRANAEVFVVTPEGDVLHGKRILPGNVFEDCLGRKIKIDTGYSIYKTTSSCPSQTKKYDISPLGLKDIFFDFDKYNITPDAAAVLEEDAQILKDDPNVRVLIEGYTDVRGSPAYNLRLAQRRADAAKAYLVQLGIDPPRIQIEGVGETEKFAAGTTATEEVYKLNNRAHFIIISEQQTRLYPN